MSPRNLNITVGRYLKNGTCQQSGKTGECVEITVPPILYEAVVSVPEFLKLARLLQESADRENTQRRNGSGHDRIAESVCETHQRSWGEGSSITEGRTEGRTISENRGTTVPSDT